MAHHSPEQKVLMGNYVDMYVKGRKLLYSFKSARLWHKKEGKFVPLFQAHKRICMTTKRTVLMTKNKK